MDVVILDFEASGLSEQSYPIQVAYNIDEDVKSFYINPESVNEWTYWDSGSEEIHGLSREFLKENGISAKDAVDIMKKDLGEGVVYSDNPYCENMWCYALFKTQLIRPSLSFENIIDESFYRRYGHMPNQLQGVKELEFADMFRSMVRNYFDQYQDEKQHDAAADVRAIRYAFRAMEHHR